MASSAKPPAPSSVADSGQTWAQIATKNRPVRISLFGDSSPTNSTDSESDSESTNTSTSTTSIKKTSIRTTAWRTGRNSGSYFLDISSRSEGDSIIFQLIKEQFPSCRGAAPFREGGRRLLEVNLDPENLVESQSFASNGLEMSDKVHIIPTEALPSSATVVKLSLSRMPFLAQYQIQEGLTESLSKYGRIYDIGIITDPISKMFLGSGYAVLDTSTVTNTPLTHTLPWPGLPNGFHAVWENMPQYCKYCHQDGHIRDACPTARPLRLCFSCTKPGHIAANCRRPTKSSPSPAPPLSSVSTSSPSPASHKSSLSLTISNEKIDENKSVEKKKNTNDPPLTHPATNTSNPPSPRVPLSPISQPHPDSPIDIHTPSAPIDVDSSSSDIDDHSITSASFTEDTAMIYDTSFLDDAPQPDPSSTDPPISFLPDRSALDEIDQFKTTKKARTDQADAPIEYITAATYNSVASQSISRSSTPTRQSPRLLAKSQSTTPPTQ
ncbi:unnamed protein product [Absidia cylindrospora]